MPFVLSRRQTFLDSLQPGSGNWQLIFGDRFDRLYCLQAETLTLAWIQRITWESGALLDGLIFQESPKPVLFLVSYRLLLVYRW